MPKSDIKKKVEQAAATAAAQPPQGVPALPLPFPPTGTPDESRMLAGAQALLTLAQGMYQGNPGPVISSLTAALLTYTENATKNGGMPREVVDEFENLGAQFAGHLLKMAEEEREAREKGQSGIATMDTRLVGPDGRPLAPTPAAVQRKTPTMPAPDAPAEAEEEKPSGIILDPKG